MTYILSPYFSGWSPSFIPYKQKMIGPSKLKSYQEEGAHLDILNE